MSSSTSANYTKEEAKELLTKLKEEHGKITQNLIHSESNLTYTDVQKLFGNLTQAKAELGNEDAKYKLRWKNATKNEFLESLRKCYEEHGKITQSILSNSNTYPSPKYVENEFGTLSRAKLETGIKELEQIRLSDEQLEELKPEFIAQIEKCEEKYGRVNMELMRDDTNFWNPSYIQKAFGTFSKAKKQADIDSSTQIHLTDSELEKINKDIRTNKYKQNLLIGCLLGDAWIDKEDGKSARICLEMTNKKFLNWLNEKLESVVSSFTLKATAEELAEKNDNYGYTVNRENYNDMFILRTRQLPFFNQFRDWYETGEKRFPDDLELNPDICRMWYCCDGSLVQNQNCVIYSANEIDRPELLSKLFEETPVTPTVHKGGGGTIRFSKEESEKFLEWIGESPPGFEYKWNIDK